MPAPVHGNEVAAIRSPKSGRLIGKTQTATLVVEERFQNFDQTTAYAVSVTLAIVAILILIVISVLRPKEHN